MRLRKRIFIILLILVLLAVIAVVYARFIEPNMLTVSRIAVHSDVKIKPFKIVLFSDTHFGKLYNQKKIEAIVEKINNEHADVVVFGGDFFDVYNQDESILDTGYLQQQLQKIEATMMKVAVWGNHDYGGGSVRIYEDFVEKSDFVLLKDSYLEIEDTNAVILGLDDYLLGYPTNSTDYLDTQKFNVIVSHAPDIVDRLDLSPVNLVLSGHSHGGQVAIPFISKYIRPVGARNYTKGVYNFDTPRDTKLFVTKGIGMTSLPFRFMSVPEISVIDVQSAP